MLNCGLLVTYHLEWLIDWLINEQNPKSHARFVILSRIPSRATPTPLKNYIRVVLVYPAKWRATRQPAQPKRGRMKKVTQTQQSATADAWSGPLDDSIFHIDARTIITNTPFRVVDGRLSSFPALFKRSNNKNRSHLPGNNCSILHSRKEGGEKTTILPLEPRDRFESASRGRVLMNNSA